ncbi:hypothetical protein L208DRAFT_879138 [Tricholoma matsutake]|nr:hypothetical protein L208DRAFT_879138 [Tricholoma matsutake 945]
MYSMHPSLAPEIANAHGDSQSPSKSAAQLHGFTWSHEFATPEARTLRGDLTSTSWDEKQPRTLYSKLYERPIEKREVFVHSTIDVRRSASVSQSPPHSSDLSSPHPSLNTSYASVAESDPTGRHEQDDLQHGYWELSAAWPADSYQASGPRYYSADRSVLHAPMAVTEPIRPFSPPPTHRSNHQPLPARFHSSYSELSANVAFLSEIKSQSTSSSKGSSAENFSEPSTPAATSRALQPESRLETSTVTPTEPPTNRLATQPRPIVRRKNLPDGERRNGTPSPRASGNLKMLSGKKGNDVRRQPSLACFFCRERKIACGRPAEGSVDRTCNQCARRSFPCDYPTESMRGQHKRRKTHKDGN